MKCHYCNKESFCDVILPWDTISVCQSHYDSLMDGFNWGQQELNKLIDPDINIEPPTDEMISLLEKMHFENDQLYDEYIEVPFPEYTINE